MSKINENNEKKWKRESSFFLGCINGIYFMVGEIGIMNIMLVSVTERTREIGLRKAMGARRRDILIQFLIESSLLRLLGGVAGILLGWLLGLIVGKIASASGNPFSPSISINAILLATLFSAAVGLFFGYTLPAGQPGWSRWRRCDTNEQWMDEIINSIFQRQDIVNKSYQNCKQFSPGSMGYNHFCG
jgi:ABC-type antimicrobial peptide transport system permease subunit